MSSLSKLATSSTALWTLILVALKLLLGKLGVDLPWEVVEVGAGAYAVKEAAGKVANGKAVKP